MSARQPARRTVSGGRPGHHLHHLRNRHLRTIKCPHSDGVCFYIRGAVYAHTRLRTSHVTPGITRHTYDTEPFQRLPTRQRSATEARACLSWYPSYLILESDVTTSHRGLPSKNVHSSKSCLINLYNKRMHHREGPEPFKLIPANYFRVPRC